MRFATTFVLLLAAISKPVSAQSQSQSKSQQKQDPDQMGMTCAQILQMSSSDWIAKVTAMDDSFVDGQLRGIRVYGECYDQRTDRLAASLSRSGKGPLMGARADFRDFDAALKDFTAKALEAETLTAPLPPVAPVKTAYAALYEKQFRYAFYESYEERVAKPAAPAHSAKPASAEPPSNAALTQPSAHASSAAASNDVDEMTRAKNRFGELLGALPEDKLHELHEAFGRILGLHETTSATQLAVYRYAIFVLEPSSPPAPAVAPRPATKPFSPPPF